MARLTAKTRSKIPTSEFAGPGRSFPVEDAKHAKAALLLAPKSEKAGNLSPMQTAMIQQKARRVLGVKSPQKSKVARGGK